jgi:hypothetical protein
VPLIYDFIAHTLKKQYNYFQCEAQREKYVKQGMTNKGIFFALKYFYEINNGNWEKGHGTIGIIPYIYDDSKKYWIEQEKHSAGILSIIAAQQKANSTDEIHVVIPPKQRTKKQYSISDALESED